MTSKLLWDEYLAWNRASCEFLNPGLQHKKQSLGDGDISVMSGPAARLQQQSGYQPHGTYY